MKQQNKMLMQGEIYKNAYILCIKNQSRCGIFSAGERSGVNYQLSAVSLSVYPNLFIEQDIESCMLYQCIDIRYEFLKA